MTCGYNRVFYITFYIQYNIYFWREANKIILYATDEKTARDGQSAFRPLETVASTIPKRNTHTSQPAEHPVGHKSDAFGAALGAFEDGECEVMEAEADRESRGASADEGCFQTPPTSPPLKAARSPSQRTDSSTKSKSTRVPKPIHLPVDSVAVEAHEHSPSRSRSASSYRSPSRERSPSPDHDDDDDAPPALSNPQSDAEESDVEDEKADGSHEDAGEANGLEDRTQAAKPKKTSSTRPKRPEEILNLLKDTTFEGVAESLLVDLLRVVHCPCENSPELRSFARAAIRFLVAVHSKCVQHILNNRTNFQLYPVQRICYSSFGYI